MRMLVYRTIYITLMDVIMNNIKFSLITFTTLLAAGCGGGGSGENPTPAPEIKQGQFIDSPVSNLRYSTESLASYTDSNGNFEYKDGEKISFYIGNIYLGETSAKPLITPLDLFTTDDDIDNSSVINAIRLLQSIDQNQNLDDGIQIPQAAHDIAAQMSLSFSTTNTEFAESVNVIEILESLEIPSLVSSSNAKTHFAGSLNVLGISYLDTSEPATTPSGPDDELVLNDTGLDTCTDGINPATQALGDYACPNTDFPFQDAQYGRDYLYSSGQLPKTGTGDAGFDFSKVDSSGEFLNESEETWGCIFDHTTGLMWEAKTNEKDHIHSVHNGFTWYQETNNGGDAGDPGDDNTKCYGLTQCSNQSLASQMNESNYCGKNNWRLPSRMELLNIVDLSQGIDDRFGISGYYRTSNTYAMLPRTAWQVAIGMQGGNAVPINSKNTYSRTILVSE